MDDAEKAKCTPDTIDITLDMKDGQVYCECIDGFSESKPRLCGNQTTGYGFKNYKKGNCYYKMTVALWTKGMQLKLIHFHTTLS